MRVHVSAELAKAISIRPYQRHGPTGQQVQVGGYTSGRPAAKPDAPSVPRTAGPKAPAGAPPARASGTHAGRTAITRPAGSAVSGTSPQRPPGARGSMRPPMSDQPGLPSQAQNPWRHGGKKQYLLTGRDEYIHSDDAGKSWNRSRVPEVDLHGSEDHRRQVREHLEAHGYQRPDLTGQPDLLQHIKVARESATAHQGHFGHGVERARQDHRTKQALQDVPEGAAEKPEKVPEDHREHAKVLAEAEVEAGRPLGRGISHAHLLKLAGDGRAIFKRGGEHEPNVRPWSIPHGTSHKREVAARAADELLGAGLVPPTTTRKHDGVDGSAQAWIPGAQAALDVPDADTWLNSDHQDHHRGLAAQADRMAIYDAVVGHDDRHTANFVVSPDQKLHAVDNGLSFSYGFGQMGQTHALWQGDRARRIPPDMREKLESLTHAEYEHALGGHLEPWAVAHAYARSKYLLDKDAGGGVKASDLSTQKLMEWTREKLPHVHPQMLAAWDHGPKPPGWEEEWPPKGKAGHEALMGETVEAASRGGRAGKTAPQRAPTEARP